MVTIFSTVFLLFNNWWNIWCGFHLRKKRSIFQLNSLVWNDINTYIVTFLLHSTQKKWSIGNWDISLEANKKWHFKRKAMKTAVLIFEVHKKCKNIFFSPKIPRKICSHTFCDETNRFVTHHPNNVSVRIKWNMPQKDARKWCVKTPHTNQKVPLLLIKSGRKRRRRRKQRNGQKGQKNHWDILMLNNACWMPHIAIEKTKGRAHILRMSQSWEQAQCLSHNTYQICGCPFNCVWTESDNYL